MGLGGIGINKYLVIENATVLYCINTIRYLIGSHQLVPG